MKASLIVVAMALLACVVVFGTEPDGPSAPGDLDTSAGPAFEVQVVKPRGNRPLMGLLPDGAFGLPPSVLRFDQGSGGAAIEGVTRHGLALRADGWELLVEADDDGRITPGTHVVFPIELADRQMSLRCRPGDPASGQFRATPGAGSGALDGSFRFECRACENAETGKAVDWPSSALTVRGSFAALPLGPR